MIYEVNALLLEDNALEFRRLLKYGNLRDDNGDGRETWESMLRARFGKDGRVWWTQSGFSTVPLKYEIESVYRHYFTDIQIREVQEHKSFHGPMLMDHLLVLELQAKDEAPGDGGGT